jgi:rhomboid protease GluP
MHDNQQRQSILCPNCRKLINAAEPQCPYCGTAHPGSWWKNNLWTRGIHHPDQLIRAIMYVNAGMFILSLLINPRSASFSMNPLSFLSPDNDSLFYLGGTGFLPIARYGRWWTLLSANYLHGSILHILFNMIALYQIGPFVIHEYGGYRTLVIYTLGGVLGYILSYFAKVPFTIGASAAVCGLIGAALYFGKSRGGNYGQVIYRQVGGWAIGIFAFGFMIPGINNWAHGGGMLGGILLGYLLGYNEISRETVFHKLFAAACALATVAALGWAIGSGIYDLFLS